MTHATATTLKESSTEPNTANTDVEKTLFTSRQLALIAGASYWLIFFAAIFANFMALEALKSEPISTVQQHGDLVWAGIIGFAVTVVFDLVVAWALFRLYQKHSLSRLSAVFRVIHALLMGAAVFALPPVLAMDSAENILTQVECFNQLWLVGLFFFGIHLLLLSRIIPLFLPIKIFLVLAGVMYMLDTCAHFLLPNYADYAELFLMAVAVPSILGEMSMAVWLLVKGGFTVNQGR